MKQFVEKTLTRTLKDGTLQAESCDFTFRQAETPDVIVLETNLALTAATVILFVESQRKQVGAGKEENLQ